MIKDFMQGRILEIRNIIRSMGQTFDSHAFIQKFSERYQADYVLFLSQYTQDPFRKVHAQIGRFLSVAAQNRTLPITLLRRDKKSPNIFGNETSNAEWR